MTRNNIVYAIVGALVVAVGVLSFALYDAKKKPEGVQVNIGPAGLSIEKK